MNMFIHNFLCIDIIKLLHFAQKYHFIALQEAHGISEYSTLFQFPVLNPCPHALRRHSPDVGHVKTMPCCFLETLLTGPFLACVWKWKLLFSCEVGSQIFSNSGGFCFLDHARLLYTNKYITLSIQRKPDTTSSSVAHCHLPIWWLLL